MTLQHATQSPVKGLLSVADTLKYLSKAIKLQLLKSDQTQIAKYWSTSCGQPLRQPLQMVVCRCFRHLVKTS